ncbi:hypothetical protein SCANM124S_06801 [Streptomyces canus]
MVVNPPKEMGGSGSGTNPEQLFAAGYSACFQGALGVGAIQEKADISGSTVTAKVGIGRNSDGFGLIVEIAATSRTSTRPRPGPSLRRPTRSARTRRRPAGTSP